MIKWLFSTSTKNISLIDTTHSAVSYDGDVIQGSFSGITTRWNIAGNGLIAPNEMTFDVSNTDATYTVSDFEGEYCLVTLVVDDVEKRSCKFKILRAVSYYGKIRCYCEDFLQEYLTGGYPNTKRPKEIWSSSDNDPERTDDYCVPVVLGRPYIPVRSVNTGLDRYYVLGEDISPDAYTVYEVRSPREWPNTSTWAAASYAMTGSVSSGYQLLQPIIADSTGDGSADASGLWRSGDTFYDMLCRYERDDTKNLTNPAEWVEYVLEDFGVASADLDATSFAAADANYDTLTVGFDGGGWWRKKPRESILSNLLAHTDSYLRCTDKIELYQFSATSQETITNVLSLSYSPSKVTKTQNDSGSVAWPEAYDKPHDVLNGKAVVPTHHGGTENQTSSDVLECRFFPGGSINSQKAGILYFQKKYEQKNRINLSVTFSSLTNQETLSPGQVITINNALYGGSSDVIITEMSIEADLKVNLSCVELNYLEDWSDLTTVVAKTVTTDASDGFQLATTDYAGTLSTDVDWGGLLNIPNRFLETASLGINVTDSYLGYYDGAVFQSYIQNNGNFQFRGDANNYINWNGTTLNVVGSVVIKNPTSVRSDLNVADGADVTESNTALNTSNVGTVPATTIAGWRYGSTTYINGGDIYTGTVTANQIAAGTITANEINVSDLFAEDITVSGTFSFSGASNFLYFGGGTTTYLVYTSVSGYSGVQLRSGSSYFRVDAGSSSRATIVSTSGVGISASTSISMGAQNDILLSIGSGDNIDFQESSTTNIRMYPSSSPSISPNGDNKGYIGTSSNRWKYIYGYNFYDENGLFQDAQDDLLVMSQIKPTKRKVIDQQTKEVLREDEIVHEKSGMPLLDNLSLPRWMTNYDEVILKLKQDNCDLITEADIIEWLEDYDEAGWLISRNISHFNDLTSGAVRQLDSEVIGMFELLSSRITALETANTGAK